MRTEENLTDEDLWIGVQRQEHLAMNCLFDRYYERLYFYAESFTYDAPTADDIVQNVLMRVWQNATRLHINISLRAYLFIAVRNECIKYMAKLRIRDSHNRKWAQAYIESLNVDMLDDSQQELLTQVRQIIENLPEQCRKIYCLRMEHGYPYKEIARLCDTSEEVVKVQMFRATRKIREILSGTDTYKAILLYILSSIHP